MTLQELQNQVLQLPIGDRWRLVHQQNEIVPLVPSQQVPVEQQSGHFNVSIKGVLDDANYS